MKKFIYNKFFKWVFGLLILFSSFACQNDSEPENVILASFSISSSGIFAGEAMYIKNESSGTFDTVFWDFGDGSTSSDFSPKHVYTNYGNYTITLKIKNNSTKKEQTFSKSISVSISNEIYGRVSLKDKLTNLKDKMLVCAHRAIGNDKPENSLSAIQNSIDENIEIVELDIRETKDGELVLMHDATLQRTTTGTGNVNSFTLQELKQYNLEKENGTLTTEKIPTLKEVFDLARGKIYINLDLDEKAAFEKVYNVAKQYGMLKQVMFYTKDNSVIRTILRTNVDLLVLPFIDDETELNSFSSSNLNIVHYSTTSFTAGMVQNAYNKSIGVYANVYVNTSTTPQSDNNFQIDRFIALKGNVIQTDHPTYIKKYLQQKNLN